MLLKNLIEIPDFVGDQDFVLKLTDGVTNEAARRTLSDYVITPTLTSRFDDALSLIKSTLGLSEGKDGGLHQGPHQKGRAVYLHGSFGSGKSHFMAVLHRLLVGDVNAMSRPELAPAVAKHGSWLGKKRFLLVPYHMLGARSLEERVFDGYCRVMAREHPDMPLPALFDTDAVIANAEAMRKQLGDETFLKLLVGDASDDGWGDYGGTWTIEEYLEAVAAPVLSESRQHLATALIERVFPSQTGSSGTTEFGTGIELMTRHAKSLGYDAIILFLDELILWLASRASTPGFIEAQADKLVNIVESDRMDRPIPVIGFIARQRDLKSLIHKGMPGADQLNIESKLSHHEGRFAEIRLETTDLPEIASQRLLKPRDAESKSAIDLEFQGMTQGQGELQRALLGDHHTIEQFRKVYPFSPVLVDALVQASSMLQRERTALRAMLQLLVERRETLDVGEIIPVGDLYDVISRGNDAVSGAFKEGFDRARQLYERKLRPLLEEEHGVSPKDVELLDWNDDKRRGWRADDRILKTLLVANLVSGVSALEGLDAKRIAFLNHGSIKARIPGQEGAMVLRKIRAWATRVPEIRVTGDPVNPQISLELHGVDVESVISNAMVLDNHGNRIALIKELLLGSLDLKESGSELYFDLEWRGTRRRASVLLANVANLPLASLENPGGDWKVVIDYPVDEQPDGAVRDQRKIDEFRETGRESKTVVWAPLFLNHVAQQDLGRLVVIDRVLRSDQSFEQYSQHLSSTDRAQARSLLKGQLETLRHTVRGFLLAAYGLSNDTAYTKGIDDSVSVPRRFISLHAGLELQSPGTGDLAQGLRSLAEQALKIEFPAAPGWTRTFTKAQMGRALEICLGAAASPNWRATLDTADLKLMRDFSEPLGLGRSESAFVLVDTWKKSFQQQIRMSQQPNVAAGDLYGWMDQPEKRGLPREVKDLLVIVYAAMSECAIVRDGEALGAVGLGDLRSEDVLRETPLPSEEDWARAQLVAGAVFGVTADLYRTGSNVASLARRVQKEAEEALPAAGKMKMALDRVPEAYLGADSVRLADAGTTLDLFDSLIQLDPRQVAEKLAAFTFPSDVTAESVARSWRQAIPVTDAIETMNWELLDIISGYSERPDASEHVAAILKAVRDGLARSELIVALPAVLRKAERDATTLMRSVTKPNVQAQAAVPTVTPTVLSTELKPESGHATLTTQGDLENATRVLKDALATGKKVDLQWTIRGGSAGQG